jgi:hypothetical protein
MLPILFENSKVQLGKRSIMVQQFRPNFPHRLNANGTYDSICTKCHLTIATVKAENELAQHERNHECNPIRLYQLSERSFGAHAIDILEQPR